VPAGREELPALQQSGETGAPDGPSQPARALEPPTARETDTQQPAENKTPLLRLNRTSLSAAFLYPLDRTALLKCAFQS